MEAESPEPQESKDPKKPLITRRRAMGAIAGAGAACFADAFLVEPRWLSVTRKEIVCPGLNGSHDGLRIGVIADIHYKPGRMDGLLERCVERLLEEKPDLIFMPGDFVDSHGADVEPMMKILSRLEAKHGVFACMGNHDGWTHSGGKLRQGFEKIGVNFLINDHSRLQIKGEALAIAATDHVWLGNPAPARTLVGLEEKVPVIAMVHEPDFFDEMLTHRPLALQVSGHTHGGQCRVPFVGYAPRLPKFGKKYIYGTYEKYDSRIFVSRGVGTTGTPVRFACRPEVAILTLRAKG